MLPAFTSSQVNVAKSFLIETIQNLGQVLVYNPYETQIKFGEIFENSLNFF